MSLFFLQNNVISLKTEFHMATAKNYLQGVRDVIVWVNNPKCKWELASYSSFFSIVAFPLKMVLYISLYPRGKGYYIVVFPQSRISPSRFGFRFLKNVNKKPIGIKIDVLYILGLHMLPSPIHIKVWNANF